VGFIGSGQIGSAIARLAIEAGHQVVLSNSRGPETLADLAADLGPRASAAASGEAAGAGDIVHRDLLSGLAGPDRGQEECEEAVKSAWPGRC
jgi:3-hydroxyisobutyrate dehydrogenase-like beta-hydroxyacid dehydrogenase